MLKKIIVGIVVVLAVAGYFIFGRGEELAQDFITVERTNLVQEVSVTGSVKPTRSANLAFEIGGRIVSVSAGVGARVGAGQVLAVLDGSELTTKLTKAEADLAVSKADLEKAVIDLDNYYADIEDTLNDAYAKANDAVRKQLDDLFSDDERNPQLTFTTSDVQLETNIESQRLKISRELNDWLSELRGISGSTTNSQLEAYLVSATVRLMAIRSLLDDCTTAIVTSLNLSATSASTYQTSINAAKTNINTALGNINSQKQNISSQKAVVVSKEAGIKSAEANSENIKTQMEKLTLRSPFGGTVTKQDAKVGQIAKANEILVSVISSGSFEIEANIPEADVAKVKIGNLARVTLDAYGSNDFFEARVTFIDPAETVIEGVSTYKTKMVFLNGNGRIKSGMTANVDIVTAEKEGVITVPRRAIITRGDTKFVLVEVGAEEPEERIVLTGLRGSDGSIEIVEGLSEGEKVITTFPAE